MTTRHRAPSTNMALGFLLAFNAGAVNAGGFLMLHMYTSHMSGFASQLADAAVLGNITLLLNAIGALLAFTSGAAVCAIIVNWGRRRRLNGIYAIPILLEALLMLPFGLVGAIFMSWRTPFALPVAVLLLSFIMGLQNAVASKTSGGSIRTTHMTGNVTDLGMELGKMLYWNRVSAETHPGVRHNPRRMKMAGGLFAMFVLGACAGALGFKYVGFVCVIPLAALLLLLALPPVLRDAPRMKELLRERRLASSPR